MVDDDLMSRTVAELVGLLVDDETTAEMLGRIAELTCLTIAGCDACSLVLWDGHEAAVVAATDQALCAAEEAQYGVQRGPGPEAVSSHAPVWSAAVADDDRWPAFGPAVAAAGYRSALAFPLRTTGAPLGVMSMYARHDGTLTGATEPITQLAVLAAVAIVNSRLYADARAVLTRLETAAPARYTIEVAKGIVIAERQCTADEAFDWLRHESQDRNEKLRDLAADVVDRRTSRIA